MKTAVRTFALILALLLLIPGGSSVAEAPGNEVKRINHRRYNADAPENTLPAFERSAEAGFRYVETDISFTADRVPVLLHDLFINRTARREDGSELKSRIRISEITYEEALAYNFGIWKGEEFRRTRIPAFESFLALCREHGLHPYIELKEEGIIGRELIAGLVDTVREYGMQDGVTWISFNIEYLEWVRDLDPHARLGYLAALWFSQDGFDYYLRRATALRKGSNEVFLDVSIYMLELSPGGSEACVAKCREAGIPLEVWTVDIEEALQSLDPYISGVTTNRLAAP